MKKIFVSLLFCCAAFFSNAQTEALNQLDANGKKHGRWIVYLDDIWKETDSSAASYYRYTHYDHGTNVYPMGPFREKWRLQVSENDPQNGKPKLLDGEYKWLDGKGRLRSVTTLQKGEFTSYTYYNSEGQLTEYFDYTKKWEGQELSYRMDIYKKNGRINRYYMRKGPQGWLGYFSGPDSTATTIHKISGDTTFMTAGYYYIGKPIREQEQIVVSTGGEKQTILHGHSTVWYYNGQKKSEGNYRYGNKTGEWNYWSEKGKPVSDPEPKPNQ